MCDIVENVRGILESEFGIGVGKGNDVVGNQLHLLNCPRAYAIMYQSIQKVQPTRTNHVVCEDEVLLREVPKE